jgi:hypothetical protein
MKTQNRYVVAIAIVIMSSLSLLAAWAAIQPKSPGASQPTATPTPNNLTRISRTVTGTNWRYTVSQAYESKFNIKVESATDSNNKPVVRISGQGCNYLSAEVSQTKADNSSASTQLGSQTYYLNGPTSTLMACVDERQTYDALLSSEITSIFQSLVP